MTHTKTIGIAAVALMLSASAEAGTYTKAGLGRSAATGGVLVSNAEFTNGLGTLDAITGSLNFQTLGAERATIRQSYADLFAIDVTGLVPFSATTVGLTGNPGPGTSDVFNTVLYLFDSSGKGILDSDDDPAATFGSEARSTITDSTLTPGLYYLGISTFGNEPTSAGGLIFPDQTDPTVDPTQLAGPTGPGGGQGLSGWKVTSEDVEAGTYTIALTGAAYAAVPEPAPWALLTAGCLLLAAGVRRRPARV